MPELTPLYKHRKNLSELAARFKLSIDGVRYAHVYIWKTKAAMYDNVADASEDYLARYIGLPYRVNVQTGIPVLKPKFAEIHIITSDIGAGVFAHELQHLVLDWIAVNGLDYAGEHNEKICYITQEMTALFWIKFYDHFEEGACLN